MSNFKFFIDFDESYLVSVYYIDSCGYGHFVPLARFYEQGDAILFRDFDLPRCTESDINTYIRNYKRTPILKRLSCGDYIPWSQWLSDYCHIFFNPIKL